MEINMEVHQKAKNSYALIGHSVLLPTWETEMKRISALDEPRQIVHETPFSKITTAKWTGGVAQVLEHVLCKSKALSLNPNPTKKKKKKAENRPTL
jgi:hypothetical protein